MTGLRDYVLLAVLAGLVPVSLFRPWLGVLAWFWIAYMVPHSFTWGFARTLPVAAMIGGATLAGFLFAKDRKPLPRSWTLFFLFLFTMHVTATTLTAYNPDLAWQKWDWVAKSLLMTFVTMSLFQDRTRLRWLYLVTALSLGVHGLKGGLWVLRTGGFNRVFGPDFSFFADNNTVGLALCMVLPLLLYLSREEPRPWLKKLLRVTFAFSIIAILFTYSRGAFVGLAVVLGTLIWRSPWRLRFATAVVLVALIVTPILPEQLKERIGSISEQESAETRDRSVAGRFDAWATSWQIATDHPFMGEGFRALLNLDLGQEYYGNEYVLRDAHSLYFEVLGEHGFVGLGLYLLILLSTLRTLRRVRKRWREHPEHGYLSRYAEMTQLSIYSFLVAGAFITVAYFDLYTLLVATGIILGSLSFEAEQAVATAPAPAAVPALPKPAPPGPLALPRPPAGQRPRPRHA